jgi:hypothetical protein
MGLDIVAMVLEVEKQFDVKLPDRQLEKMRTFGNLVDMVVQQKQAQQRKQAMNRADIAAELKLLVGYELGCSPDMILEETRFVEDLGAD